MSKVFTEQLQRLANNPNLGRGFITLAGADLLRAQKQATLDTLTNLNKAVNLTNQDISTTAQQLKQLQADPTGTNALANIAESAAQYEAMTRNLIARKKKFGETFNKTMMALSIIGGKDAQLAGNVVEQRKEDLLKNIDSLIALPDKTLRQKVLQTNLVWSQEKYRELLDNKERFAQVRQVENEIINDPNFSDIHGGDYNTFSPAEQAKLDKNIAQVIKTMQSKFGNTLMDGGVIADAFKLALDNTRKKFSFRQYIDKTSPNSIGTKSIVASGLASLKGWSARYAGLPKSVQDALGNMIVRAQNPNAAQEAGLVNPDGTPMTTEQILARNNVDKGTYSLDVMKELYNIYKPEGLYLQTYAYLSQFDPNLSIGEDYGQWLKGNFTDITVGEGDNRFVYKVPNNQNYRDIIIPTGEYAFGYPDGRWQAGNSLQWIRRQSRERAPDNTTFGVYNNTLNSITQDLFKDLHPEQQPGFSGLFGTKLPLKTKTSTSKKNKGGG